ncbi:MAG: hypothetical protein M5U01_36965 [Ardenticatenaceae bacterium]|nr:hypothetical protein [Ardenticatenaceae bacterium]HBY95906.1 hypothetical protein [Chloroflexota bacterium]
MTEQHICEYCGKEFEGKGKVAAPKGKDERHYFCQWVCYILWRYNIDVDLDFIHDPSVGVLVEWPYGRIRSEWEQDIEEQV